MLAPLKLNSHFKKIALDEPQTTSKIAYEILRFGRFLKYFKDFGALSENLRDLRRFEIFQTLGILKDWRFPKIFKITGIFLRIFGIFYDCV